MDNLPTGSSNTDARPRPVAAPQKTSKNRGGKKKLPLLLIGAVVALVLVGLAVWGIYRTSTSAHIEGSKYQAVFLSNGQVYFGKLTRLNSSYMKLSDVFYIQSATEAENPQETEGNKATDVQLIKLGNEVHGPEDAMIIEKNQILFFENLKKDGKVSGSIQQYKSERQ